MVIKEEALTILLNAELNYAAQKSFGKKQFTHANVYETIWPLPTVRKVHLSFYGEKPKIIGLFSGFGNIAYITNRGGFEG